MPKVLAAVDGSEFAMNALDEAVHLFGTDADYVLLSVVPSGSALADGLTVTDAPGVRTHGTSTGSSPFAPTADSVAAASEAVYDFYRSAQRQASARAGVTGRHVIEEAKQRKHRIGRVICDSAIEHGCDVIVVGSHGSSHTGEVLLGSVSQYVLHHAGCPVIVVAHRSRLPTSGSTPAPPS